MTSRTLAPGWLTRGFPVALVGALLIAGARVVSAVENDAEAIAASEKRLTEDVGVLAADAMEGRGVGTKGLDQAGEYVAGEFARLGLRVDVIDGKPYQPFQAIVGSEMGPKENNRLRLKGPAPEGSEVPRIWDLTLGKEYTPLAAGGSGDFGSGIVFAGYGIQAPDLHYDDFANVDVKDKVVVLLRKEPQQADPHSVFDGDKPSQHATFQRKFAVARDRGAKAILLVNDQYDLSGKFESDRKAYADALAKLVPPPTDASPETFLELVKKSQKPLESLQAASKRLAAGTYDELLAFQGAGDGARGKMIPVVFCLRSAIDPMVKVATGKTLSELESEIDGDLKPRSQELAGWTVEGEANVKVNDAQIRNVIAVMEGEGPLADETIVIGAHYDHVGMGGAESLAPWTREVHNGADDNASGTATLVEVAHRLKTSGYKPKRRIVFIAFTGEEKGLLGSAHYCEKPVFPLEKTVAMLNMDMVGRLADDKLIVYGTGTATEFDALVTTRCEAGGFKLTKQEGGYGPSDHASFYARKIPVLHFFTGNHPDYHRPSDDVEKLNVVGMRRVADLVVEIARSIDQTESRPTYVEIKKIESIADAGDRPYFGSIPDYAADVEGLKISGVQPEGPAAKGGLQGGDVITAVGETKIVDIEAFQLALMKHKPGDTVKVKYLRDDKEMETEVTLGKRPSKP